jgi:hypothetical protein
MPFRRTFAAVALGFLLGGTLLPIDRIAAQIGQPATAPSAPVSHGPPDVGWIGLLGLVGLFGLFGSKRADRTMS